MLLETFCDRLSSSSVPRPLRAQSFLRKRNNREALQRLVGGKNRVEKVSHHDDCAKSDDLQ